ncbi:serine/threonine-protein kinase STY46-like [Nicotiana tabacum]|uniref:non-specific serine/threonine protein kinase n=1 Tax=Nicotiana tabacum TaxID=4097 RepID=A0A1S3YZE1_TOBAC|nr:serine/threonine-protein kinase STY46-like isoform X1 [Nicotiana tomentosiformis]XP_016457564.1 PREDICTED: serine/threonine-protein kinase STY46-like isoform X2 [Nicotiana tabacum]
MEDAVSFSSRGLSESPQSRITRKRREKVEVFQEVLRRLRESNDEDTNQPDFEDELWAHFTKLPLRYALFVNIERAQDVVMHKKLLQMAHYQSTRPAVEVRLVQIHRISDGNPGDSVHSTFSKRGGAQGTDHNGSMHPPPAFGLSPSTELALEANKLHVQDGNSAVSGNSLLFRSSYEITISTLDKPKLLTQLTSLFSEIGLNIQEAHAFSTKDGYSLDVFVVDGWGNEETDQLRSTLLKEISNMEKQSALNQHLLQSALNQVLLSPKKDLVKAGINFTANHVDIPSNGSEAWEIDAALLKYEYKIATGSTGDLYKGSFQSQEVAIKVLKAECLNEVVQKDFAQEVYILRKVRHKNVVQFIGACIKPPLLCIITEFMSGGSLYDFLHKTKGLFNLPSVLKVAIDVSKGMIYLHQNNIIHRDLKTANLLMDENQLVKVADFGVARVQVQSGVMTAETGTYRWMAPEVIGHRPYDRKADVFSFGIVLWELLTGKLPYEYLTPLQAAVAVVQKGLRPTIPTHTHPMFVELLERCWQQDPCLRPEFSEILEILQYMTKKIVEEEKSSKRRSL